MPRSSSGASQLKAIHTLGHRPASRRCRSTTRRCTRSTPSAWSSTADLRLRRRARARAADARRSTPTQLDEVCWFFPELKIVTRHGAEPWTELMVKLLLKWPNLYYSTSRVRPEALPAGHHRLRQHPRRRQDHLRRLLRRRPDARPHLRRAAHVPVPRPRLAQVPPRERRSTSSAAPPTRTRPPDLRRPGCGGTAPATGSNAQQLGRTVRASWTVQVIAELCDRCGLFDSRTSHNVRYRVSQAGASPRRGTVHVDQRRDHRPRRRQRHRGHPGRSPPPTATRTSTPSRTTPTPSSRGTTRRAPARRSTSSTRRPSTRSGTARPTSTGRSTSTPRSSSSSSAASAEPDRAAMTRPRRHPVRASGPTRSSTRWRIEPNNWMLSQFMHGEQGALICTAKIVETVPWIDAKYYAATQVMDEARHVEVFAKYLDTKLNGHYPLNAHLGLLLDDIINDSRWDMTYLGMQIMVEGLALAAFGFMHMTTPEPLLKQLLRYVMSDEARHVAFGVLVAEGVLRRADRRRDPRAPGVRLRGRRAHARPPARCRRCWERMGVDVKAAVKLAMRGRGPRGSFQQMLFSKIVPNCKKLGLLDAGDGWLRDQVQRARRHPVRGLGRHQRRVRGLRPGRGRALPGRPPPDGPPRTGWGSAAPASSPSRCGSARRPASPSRRRVSEVDRVGSVRGGGPGRPRRRPAVGPRRRWSWSST